MEICAYTAAFRSSFKTLNEEWLKKFFTIEPYDALLLENCESEIINKGGHIFFGIDNNEVIAKYAFLPTTNKCVELGKMAVTETHQGKGYGQQLLKHVLETARTLGYTEILLYSNRILQNSIHLYKKYGFKEVSNIDSPYKRGDIKMLIKL